MEGGVCRKNSSFTGSAPDRKNGDVYKKTLTCTWILHGTNGSFFTDIKTTMIIISFFYYSIQVWDFLVISVF